MSAPLFLLDEGRLRDARAGDEVVLAGDEGRHAATVRRLGPGESVQLADGTGRVARGEVASAARHELTVRVLEVEDRPAPDPRFVLVQALAKGDRDQQAVEAATELGVDEVVPWQADRSIVVWRGDRAARALRKWRSLVRAASKQSRRATVPAVSPPAGRSEVAARVAGAQLALLLDESAESPLVAEPLPTSGEILLLVGPEGGVSPEEAEALVAAGARRVRLGDTVLRSSSAGPAALAALLAATRWR